MTTLKQAARMAIEALEEHGSAYLGHETPYSAAISALSQAFKQPNQEPMACNHGWFRTGAMSPGEARCIKCGEWKKAEPPKRKPLTDEEVMAIEEKIWRPEFLDDSERKTNREFARAIESKIKELNT